MSEYSSPDPGVTILRLVEQFHSPRTQDRSASSAIVKGLCRELYDFTIPRRSPIRIIHRVVEGLSKVLEIENTELLINAAAAVPKVADYADSLVPRLKELATGLNPDGNHYSPKVASTAFYALGSLHSSESRGFLLETLKEMTENPEHPIHLNDTLQNFFFIALGEQGEYLAAAIPHLEKLLENAEFNVECLLHIESALIKITEATSNLSEDWAKIEFPSDTYLDFRNFQALTANGVVLDLDQPPGTKVYDDRLRFQFADRRSECRVRIFSGNNHSETIVMFTSDAESYGHTITESIEILANGARAYFGLDLENTVFFEHATYGKTEIPYRIGQNPDVCEVTFQDVSDGNADSPTWRQIRDPYFELNERFNITDPF